MLPNLLEHDGAEDVEKKRTRNCQTMSFVNSRSLNQELLSCPLSSFLLSFWILVGVGFIARK
ncbi:unnamed protein product, partial [Vitis vinifera]|uniref:Uncharacterized protein n=1 Tax=Vitis vinifera TaxID=29760 RepID=D7U3N0_VITVI